MSTFKIQKQLKYLNNEKLKNISGLFPVIVQESNTNFEQNSLIGKDAAFLVFNNSKLISNKTNSAEISQQTSLYNADINFPVISIAINNSFQTVENINSKTISVLYSNTNNSFTNFPYFIATSSLLDSVGGCEIVKNNKVYYSTTFNWSSVLTTDGSQQYGLYWEKFNQNSFITNTTNSISISGNLLDEYSVSKEFFNNNPINGYFKTINFNCYNLSTSNINLNFNKNYILIKNISGNSTISTITLNSVFQLTINAISISNLNIQNSQIYLYNISNPTNINLKNSLLHISTNISNYSNIKNSDIYIKSILESNFSANAFNNIYLDSYRVKTADYVLTISTYPQYGNNILNKDTLKTTYSNNNYKYGLESHSHKISGKTSGRQQPTIFPIQSTKVLHSRYNTSSNRTIVANYLRKDATTTYYPTDLSINQNFVSQNTTLPVGSIVGFIKNGDNIPYGFYQLTNAQQTIWIDADDPTSKSYNVELAKLLQPDKTKQFFILPAISNPSITISGVGTIVKIIKYSQYWSNK